MLAARTYSIAELQAISGFDRRTIVYYLQQGLVPRAGRRGPHTRYSQDALLRLRFIRGLKDLQDQGRCGTVTLREIRALLDQLEPAQVGVLVERGMPMEEIGPLLERLASAQSAVPSAPAAAASSATPAAAAPAPASPAAAAAPPGASAAAAAATVAPPAGPGRPVPGLLGPAGPRRSYGLADAGIRPRPAPPPASATTTTPPPGPPASPSAPPPLAPPASAAPGGAAPSPGAAEVSGELGALLRELEVRPALAGRRLAPGASEQWTEIPITSRVFLSVRGLSADDAPLADAVARELKKILRGR